MAFHHVLKPLTFIPANDWFISHGSTPVGLQGSFTPLTIQDRGLHEQTRPALQAMRRRVAVHEYYLTCKVQAALCTPLFHEPSRPTLSPHNCNMAGDRKHFEVKINKLPANACKQDNRTNGSWHEKRGTYDEPSAKT